MRFLIEFIAPALLVLGFLYGIRLMQSPRTAVRGNRIGALCMFLAVLLTFWLYDLFRLPQARAALTVGAVLGALLAQRAKTIQMPQLVALLNGLGGAASALVLAALIPLFSQESWWFSWLITATTLAVGSTTFSGSMVAALKLHGWISPKPRQFKGHSLWIYLSLGVGAGLVMFLPILQQPTLLYVVILLFLAYGILMAIRVGGADMPVIISLLNSLSGVAACVGGFALGNMLAAGVGALVGVAGMILTQIMCRAMNRNLAAVLGGFKPYAPAQPELPPNAQEPDSGESDEKTATDEQERLGPEHIPTLLRDAKKVMIVPGYGMALSQAQEAVKTLMDTLEQAGKEVKVAVHPVAGRMPGHMHVLLAEAGVDYDNLYDMAKVNHEFAETDVVVAVGACDVMNPAATTAEGTPIYGMPILKVSEARAVIVCNLDEKPGYSGVENTLYQLPHVITLWGDASETVPGLTDSLRHSVAGQ